MPNCSSRAPGGQPPAGPGPDGGLLEQPALLLRPRPAGPGRDIARADTGAPVGSARWRGRPRRPWWRRFGRPVLAVCEQGDEPLVFTVRRCWSWLPWREVRDAEGRPVGLLLGPRVRNHFGRDVAVLTAEAGGSAFRAPDGRALAHVSAADGAVRVAFDAGLTNEPFVKMLLLAALL